VQSFLEKMYVTNRSFMVPGVYSMFTFESLHNLHLGISKLLKNCFLEFLQSNQVMTWPNGTRKQKKVLSSQRSNVLKAANAILAEIEKKYPATGIHVDFSKKEKTAQLNGFFLRDGVRGMLEGKNFRSIDLVFPFIASFIDRALGFQGNPVITTVKTMHTEVMVTCLHDFPRKGVSEVDLQDFEKKIYNFKKTVMQFYGKYCEKGLFTLKFHLLDHMVEDMRKFGTLSVLDASAYEHFNTDIKAAVRRTSQRSQYRMDETVAVLSDPLQAMEGTCTMLPMSGPIQQGRHVRLQNEGCFLVRDGVSVSLMDLKTQGTETFGERTGPASSKERWEEVLQLFPRDSLEIFIKLLEDFLSVQTSHYHDGAIQLQFVQSGFVMGGFIPTSTDYVRSGNYICEEGLNDAPKLQQRIYGTTSFGPTKHSRFSFVLMKGEQDGKAELWVAKVMALFHVSWSTGSEECAFVQFMQCTPPLDSVDDILKSTRGRPVVVGDWYGIEPVQSIVGSVHVVRSNFAVSPFTKELPWSHHRFYINRFYRDFS